MVQLTTVLLRTGKDTKTQRKRLHETKEESGVMLSQAKEFQEPPGRGKKGFFPGAEKNVLSSSISGNLSPQSLDTNADTLIMHVDSHLLNVCILSHPFGHWTWLTLVVQVLPSLHGTVPISLVLFLLF